MNFPTMVYKSPGPHKAGHGRTYGFISINDEVQLDKALNDGWCETLDEALADTKGEAIAKAEKLGIRVDKRMKTETIEKKVIEAEEARQQQTVLSTFFTPKQGVDDAEKTRTLR